MNFLNRLSNSFKPSLINIIVVICLILIILLVYIKTKQIDLFYIIPETTNTQTIITNPVLTALTGTDFLTTFINKYINNVQQQNKYANTLATQELKIQNLSQQVTNLINPSS
jgi:uncharacterized protein YoxC